MRFTSANVSSLALLIALAVPVSGQQPPVEIPEVLAVGAALRIAREHAPAVARADLDRRQAQIAFERSRIAAIDAGSGADTDAAVLERDRAIYAHERALGAIDLVVVTAFLDVADAQARIEPAELALERARLDQTSVAGRVRVGAGDQTDLLAAGVSVRQAESSLAGAIDRYRAEADSLLDTIGATADDLMALSFTRPGLPSPRMSAVGARGSWTSRAVAGRRELTFAARATEIAAQRVEASRAEGAPPLDITEAELYRQAAALGESNAAGALADEVTATYREVAAAERSFSIAELSLERANAVLAKVRRQVEAGLATASDLLGAEITATNARLDRERSVEAFFAAQQRLRVAAVEPVEVAR